MDDLRIKSEKVLRRVKIAYVPEKLVWQVFGGLVGVTGIRLPVFPGVPEDAGLLNVWYSGQCRAFAFLLAHPSFDEVPLGCHPPALPMEELALRVVPIRDDDEQAAGLAEYVIQVAAKEKGPD